MTLPRIGMDMDALLTQQHGMVAWLEHLRAEVVRCTLFFHLASPLSLFPIFLFSLVSGCTSSTTPLFPHSPSVLLLVWGFPQSCCSVCHTIIVILTTHLYDVLLPPPLSSFPLPTHQQAALGCEASCTWIAGMLAAAPEEDLVTKEHTILSSNTPPPFLMSVNTRHCSSCALP